MIIPPRHSPHLFQETKFLLPKPALSARDIKPPQWVNMVQVCCCCHWFVVTANDCCLVQGSWAEVQDMSASQAKAQVLQILAQWQLFGSSFFAVSSCSSHFYTVFMNTFQVRRDSDPIEGSEHILALNKHGVHFLDLITHETILHYPFTEVISTRQMETEDGVLYLDMKCGNLMQQRISRIQTDQAVEIARLIKQYITIGEK